MTYASNHTRNRTNETSSEGKKKDIEAENGYNLEEDFQFRNRYCTNSGINTMSCLVRSNIIPLACPDATKM